MAQPLQDEFARLRGDVNDLREEVGALEREVESLPPSDIKRQLEAQLLAARALLGIAGRIDDQIDSRLKP